MNPLQQEQVEKAVTALLKHEANKAAKNAGGKESLLSDDSVISLLVGMKDFPKKTRSKAYMITLPHSLHENSEICLIVKDPQRAIKQRLEKDPIDGVVKVIGLSKLRKNYKTYEAKRNLCDGYDLFLADRGVLPMLPRLLGKTFFTKKKQPIAIEVPRTSAGLAASVSRARDSTQMWIGDGPCSAIRVAHSGMSVDEIVANIVAAATAAAKFIPQGWQNVQALNIKTVDSIALPVFSSVPQQKLKIDAA